MISRAHGLLATALVGTLVALTGCAAPPPAMPPPLSDDQVRAILVEQQADWWLSMFPAEPVPVIEPIAEIAEGDQAAVISRCVLALGLEGVVADESSGWFLMGPGADSREVNRAQYTCTAQYPVEITDPTAWGLLSEAQLSWLYDFYDARLIPCLRLSGFLVGALPPRGDFVDSISGHWSPYYAMSPQPDSPSEWARIDARCPPPPFGNDYRPGILID